MYIPADEFTNPILKKIAEGDEAVFVDTAENAFDLTEEYEYKEWSALAIACNNGHLNVVNKLLEIPKVVSKAENDRQNHSLCMAAENGHLKIVNKLLRIPGILAKSSANYNYSFFVSAENGHLDVVIRLLEIERVASYVRTNNYYALHMSSWNGHLDVLNRLLEIPDIAAHASSSNNRSLRGAAKNGHFDVVNRLLQMSNVVADIAYNDNEALCMAAQNSHREIAYTLAKIQWPRGVIDMPMDLHKCLPAIYQGAIIASGRKEFEGMVKCWIRGNPANNTNNIYYPGYESLSKDLVRIDKYNAPRTIMQYAGCKDVVKESESEIRVSYGMNTLLYSSWLHKRFQAAYEVGQKENKKRSGYGEGAMTIYSSNKRRRPGA